jgi:hypothetical protein
MGTSGSRMRPETQIRANASKLWEGGGARVVSMVGKERDLNIPKEDEKSKDDIVLPRLKVPDYRWRGCAGIR